MGTKFTAFFLLPGAALALGLYAFWRLGRTAWRPVAALAVSCTIGFILFGSYNYILNLLNYGHPLQSEASVAYENHEHLAPEARASYANRFATLVRYAHQMVDWNPYLWLEPHLGTDLFTELEAQQVGTYDWMSETFDLNLRVGSWATHPLRGGSLGYGLIGFLLVLLSPAALIGFAAQSARSPSEQRVLSLTYLAVGLSWFLLFVVLVNWSPWRMRLFAVFVPYLVAAVLPWIYSRRWVALLWVMPVILFSVLNFFSLPRSSEYLLSRIAPQTFTPRLASTYEQLDVQVLELYFLDSPQHITLTGQLYEMFPLMQAFPEASFSFQPGNLSAEPLQTALEQGTIDLVIADADTDCSWEQPVPVVPTHLSVRYCFYVQDPIRLMNAYNVALAYTRPIDFTVSATWHEQLEVESLKVFDPSLFAATNPNRAARVMSVFGEHWNPTQNFNVSPAEMKAGPWGRRLARNRGCRIIFGPGASPICTWMSKHSMRGRGNLLLSCSTQVTIGCLLPGKTPTRLRYANYSK
ncbi:MAG: hypothetical protein HC915_03395 [Anaerolineae bacterium]|nr:hypothetical protein [Anaerolineae bacterium]